MYVYYRVSGDAGAARAAVTRLFAFIEAQSGVCGRLLERCDDPGTWMEVYEPVPDAAVFRAVLERASAAFDATAHAEGARRHVECFTATGAPRGVAPQP